MNHGKRTSPPHRLAKILLILLGFLIGGTIAEIALRVAGYSYPEFYQPDQTRGYSLRPGMKGWYRKEGEAYVEINSDGLRDGEHTKAKPADTIRIAVIGDSYPEAFPVKREDAFWAVMENRLQGCQTFAGKNVEVLNFGVSGYGTAQELITLHEHVWSYSPDIVLLAVTTNNDITDNVRSLKKTDEIPYFTIRDGNLVLDDSFKTSKGFQQRLSLFNRFGRWLKDHSRLVQAVNQGHHGFKILLQSWKARLRAPNQPKSSDTSSANAVARSEELGTDNLVYLEPRTAEWNEAWQVTEKMFLAMKDEVHNHGARFVIVTLSNGPQVLPSENSRKLFMERFGITDLMYPDNRIKKFAETESVPVITLAPELQAYAEKNSVLLHGFGENIGNGHWNVTGHRVAGELIADKLCAPGFLK